MALVKFRFSISAQITVFRSAFLFFFVSFLALGGQFVSSVLWADGTRSAALNCVAACRFLTV